MQTTITQAAIQAATVLVIALKEADKGLQQALIWPMWERHTDLGSAYQP